LSERKVPKVRPKEAPPNASVRAARVAPRRLEEPRPATQVAPARQAALAVRPASEAWEKLAAPLREGKGQRIVVYGITGKGKTTGVKQFLAYLHAENLIDLVLVHDVKFRDKVQYEGKVIFDARAIYTAEGAPQTFPASFVLRKRGLDHMPSVDTAARVVMESANEGIRSMLLVDEFARAIEEDIPGGFRKGSTNRIACEGYGLGASLIAIKQLPQFMPTEVRTQSELVLFGMGGDGLTHLVDEKAVSPKMAETIHRLGVGHFVIKPAEGDPDGLVYKVPPP
jgi:hypothetical protein